jgi:hypothetical protein
MSFKSFITPSIIQLVYTLFLILAGLAALVVILAGFAENAAVGLLALIFSPIVFILYVIVARIYLEVVIVLFRIAENTADIRNNTGR